MDTQKRMCAEALDHIEAYLDGELDDELGAGFARRLEAHLATCPECAAELAWARRVRDELRALPRMQCPPGVTSPTAAPVVAFPRRPGPSSHSGSPEPVPPRPESLRPSWGRRFAAAAAVLLAVLVGALLLHPGTPQPQYSAAELAQAEAEARLALAYLSAIQRRAGDKLRQDVLIPRVVQPPRQVLSRIVEFPQPTNQENPIEEKQP